MIQLTSTPQMVQPTTPVETAEARLAHDLEELAAAVVHHPALSELEVRRGESHVAVDERRVRSLRALPARRVARDQDDVRLLLVRAYEGLAAAYDRLGRRDRSAWASARAAEERGALLVAA